MSSPESEEAPAENPEQPDKASALFQQLVLHQTEMALMLLGAMPNPETGERMCDIDSAKLFIDQLEMLEIKTRGNLTPLDDELLKTGLTHIRLAYVNAVNAMPPPSPAKKEPKNPAPAPPPPPPARPQPEAPTEEESKKRFSKKY